MEIRTAVLAAASEATRRQAVHALSEAGIELLGAGNSGAEALRLLERLRPDLLVADAEFPGMNGCALAQRVLDSFRLPVRPAVILLHCPQFPPPDVPALSGAVLAEKPVTPQSLCEAIARLQSRGPVFSPQQHRRADDLLNALGVPRHIGRNCLKYAALICAADERCLHNLRLLVFPRIAERFKLTAGQAERSMRHVIGLAWQSDQFDNQYRIFADTVDAARGQPTCSEMISRLADILRLEG